MFNEKQELIIDKEPIKTKDDELIEKNHTWDFLIPTVPPQDRRLSPEIKYPELKDLIGQPSFEVLNYLSSQILTQQIKVPHGFDYNLFTLELRLYHKDRKSAHLKEGGYRRLASPDTKTQYNTVTGLGYIQNGGLADFIQSGKLNQMYYNSLALTNRIPVYASPFFKDTPSSVVEGFYFVKSKAGHENFCLEETDDYLDYISAQSLYLMLADFILPPAQENVDLYKKEISGFFFEEDPPIPLEGCFIKSSDRALHFIVTNPLLTLQQFLNLKAAFHLLNRINDPRAQPLWDAHHGEFYFKHRGKTMGDIPQLEQSETEKATALRLNDPFGSDHPLIIDTLEVPDKRWFDKYWKTYNFTQSFEPECE